MSWCLSWQVDLQMCEGHVADGECKWRTLGLGGVPELDPCLRCRGSCNSSEIARPSENTGSTGARYRRVNSK